MSNKGWLTFFFSFYLFAIQKNNYSVLGTNINLMALKAFRFILFNLKDCAKRNEWVTITHLRDRILASLYMTYWR